MSTLSSVRVKIPWRDGQPLLASGDRLKQPEFHRRYEECPEGVRFELIGGTVYMASPLSRPHSAFDGELGFLIQMYRRATLGTEALHNVSAILGEESEPQPDLGLRILPQHGGQSRNSADDRYVEGPPELLAEIAYSTRAIDLHAKRDDYKQAGVMEYIVVCVEEGELHWFSFPSAGRIKTGRDGVAKSRVFPGLWIHVPSLFALDSARLEEMARQGLASRAHERFASKLAARRKQP